jgi:hypothetical protein
MKKIMGTTTRSALAVSGLAAAALGLAACGTASVSKTPAARPSSAPAAPTAFTPTAEPTSIPTSTPSASTTGTLGTSFTVTTTDNSGNPVVYTVTLDKVDQHAGLAPYESMQGPGDHMAAARFSITGVTGQESDDANSDANATGSDTTEYPFAATSVSDGPNFSSGMFEVGPGQTKSGWVSFELPQGVTVSTVSWQPGLDSQAATWTLGS